MFAVWVGFGARSQDFTAQSTQSCVKQDQTCPCGANAKPCKWTDDWGYEED